LYHEKDRKKADDTRGAPDFADSQEYNLMEYWNIGMME
jgi:hypothetical protein